MDNHDNGEKAAACESARLNQELEQTRVALEDAQAEITALAEERDGLRRRIAAQDAVRQRAEAATVRAREQTEKALALVAGRTEDAAAAEEMRISLEEMAVLAEDLQRANDALLTANQALDRRVADRTRALDLANAELERLNRELRQQVEAEAEARTRAQAELFRMQKLEAIGQLTGGIAHDFNNLLTVVINGLQLLGQIGDPARRDRILRRTEEAAWRGASLTQRLLAFARRQPLNPERLELTRKIDSIRALLTHGLRENITVRTDIDPDLWPVEADITALELALLNLAVNARDAMPRGGVLVLSARNATLCSERAARLGLQPGGYVEVGLSDTGTGMPPELLEKVFEPFFTTKAEGKGTGLGLAQVYGFAKQSGGTAWVESAEGLGTTVRLLLRRCNRPAQPAPAAAPPSVPATVRYGEKLKILVVEDDDTVAAMVLDMLAEQGHSGTRVGTIASALAVLTGPEAVDLVFSDVLLPGGGSGLDLAREITTRGIGVPMILTSGYGGGMTQRLAAANLPFLHKPYRPDALKRAIEQALQPAA